MLGRKVVVGAGFLTGIASAVFLGTRRHAEFRNQVAFITGGSRGLGLVLAREFALRGASVAISARDAEELSRAETQLRSMTDRVLAIPADMTMREEAEGAVQKVIEQFRRVDILVNNAGTISVGPAETMTTDDYRDSINTHFWGPYFTTMAALPGMQKRRSGRIVNISSIGGKISVPHLLPYSVGKFALTGFSEGLRSELLKYNVYVTTVCPGLMRTGSPRNAMFKSRNEAEYAWFSVSGALPLISMSAKRAARQIVDACARGDAEIVLSLPAKLAMLAHGLFPTMTINSLALINRLLPPPGGIGEDARTGNESSSNAFPSWITVLSDRAARENNEIA